MKQFIFLFFFPMLSFAQEEINLPIVSFSPSDSSDIFMRYGGENTLKKNLNLFQNVDSQEFMVDFRKKYSYAFDKENRYRELLVAKIDDWEMKLYDERKSQLNFLKKHPNFSKLSLDFQRLVEQNIRWNYWNLLLAHPIIHYETDTKPTRFIALPNVMLEGLDPAKINDEKLMMVESYRDFLPFFIKYFNAQEHKFIHYTDEMIAFTDQVNFIQKYFKGQGLDYALTKLLYDNHGKLTASSTKFWISQIGTDSYRNMLLNHCKASLIKKEVLTKTKEDIEKPFESSDFPVLFGIDGKQFDFTKYNGKVVYVDFWASWCGPCRAEFPFSKKIYEGLSKKQKKKIIFLYVSIDEEVDNWKKAIKDLGLNNGEHGLSEGGWTSGVCQKYKISSIPRYMIIDKNGTVIRSDAPRPSSLEILDLLLKFE